MEQNNLNVGGPTFCTKYTFFLNQILDSNFLSLEIKINGIIFVHIEHKLFYAKTQWNEPQHSELETCPFSTNRAILRYLLHNIYFQFKILLSNHVSRIFWEIKFGLVIFCILNFEVGIIENVEFAKKSCWEIYQDLLNSRYLYQTQRGVLDDFHMYQMYCI